MGIKYSPENIQVEVFWNVKPCKVAVGYQCFTLKMEAAKSSEMSVSYQNITWHHNPEYPDFIFTSVKTSNSASRNIACIKHIWESDKVKVKLFLSLIKDHAIKTYWGVEV
jgi:hypothetical protein